MRWYRLKIGQTVKLSGASATLLGGNALTGNITLESQSATPPYNDNPTPLNIQFNVTVNVGMTAQVGSVIRIYNLSQDWYVHLKNQVGRPIQLEAGFDQGSPMVKKLGYPDIPEKTIVNANIQSVMGNFETLEPWVAITVGPYANSDDEQKELNERLKKASEMQTQTAVYKFQPQPQKRYKSDLLNFISNFFDESWHISFTATLVKMTLNPFTQAVFNAVTTLSQLITLLRNKFGIGMALDYTRSTCIVYKCTPGLNSSDMRDYSDIAGITGSSVKIISPCEFLSQPCAIGFNTITAVISLRADLHLGDLVILEGAIPTMSSFEGIDEFISKGINDNLKLFAPGQYMIMGINHNGDFYGTSPDSWSTQLKLVLVDSDITRAMLANASGASDEKVSKKNGK